jgi:adenine-specific DNA-methyltransferase
LHIDEIDQMDERNMRLHKVKIRAIKGLCNKIIAFLAQIEDFQKKLFEKKKFILKTDYCMTLDYVPEKFYQEIGDNESQIIEWKNLFNLDEKTQNTLQNTKGQRKLPVEFLKTNRNLVVDTRHFSEEFKWRLLSSFDDLESSIDGLLFKSENFQALNLLLEKFRGNIKSIYIDPPYNTGSDEFLYKDNYKHSSWLSMMFDRLSLSHFLLQPSGTIGVSIDNNELDNFLKLMDVVYQNRRAIITIKRGSVTGPKVINPGVVNVAEFLVLHSKSENDWVPNRVYRKRKRDKRYNKFIVNRNKNPSEWKFTSLLQQFAKFKGIPKNRLKRDLGNNYEKELDEFILENADSVVRTAALDDDKISNDAKELKIKSKDNPDIIYHFHREKYDDWYVVNGERILFYSDGLVKIGSKAVRGELVTDIWTDTLPNDLHNEGGVSLKKGKKPEKLIGRFFELTTNEGELIMDFFAGSGTACAAAQKMGRKWIGVEMANFFDSILIKRLKNTLFGETSGISSVTNWKGGGFVKYHTLEQFEDTLNNILFSDKNGLIQTTLHELPDYFLQHILNIETKDSPTRLTVDRFKTPFDYKIRTMQSGKEITTPVDLVETFNYLLGAKVKKIGQYENEQTKYIIVYGEKGEAPSCSKVLIIWRNYDEKILEKEKQFIEQKIIPEFSPDMIYVNVDSLIIGAESIEPIFKELMGA